MRDGPEERRSRLTKGVLTRPGRGIKFPRHVRAIIRRKDMMSKTEDYRRNADECERMGRSATNPEVKSHWLRLAETWLRMIPRHHSAEETFESEVRARATGQTDSTSSH